LKLLSLRLSNFRAFLGEHEIQFAHSDSKNVTIIVAENEVGKSSLLNAFLWCFYGELTDDTDRPQDLVHDDAKSNLVEVEIRLIEKDIEYLFKRILRNGKETFKAFEMKENGELGSAISFPETLIESFLPKILSNYFLFNGEGLKDIVKDSDLLNRSVQDIQGLSAAREALEKIKDFKKDIGKTLKKNQDSSDEHKRIQDDIDKYQSNIEEEKRKLTAQQNKVNKANNELKAASDAWEKVANKSAALLHSQRDTAEKELRGQKIMLNNAKAQKAIHIRTYGIDILGYPFSESAEKLLQESNEKGYPSKFERTMIEDSLHLEECQLCESKIPKNSDQFKKIKEKLDMAIDNDLKDRVSMARSSLTAMKNIITNYGVASEKLDSQISEIEESINQKKKLIEGLKTDIEKLAKNEDEIKAAEERRDKAIDNLSNEKTAEGLITAEIKSLETQLQNSRAKLPNIDSDDDSLKNEVNFLDDVCKYLDETIQSQEKSARDFIFNDMNESLKLHSKGNHMFRFKPGTFEPVIIKQKDEKPLKLSTGGKKLKRNLFFVTSLIKHSKKRANAHGILQIPGTVAPLIVDAPFTELDVANQRIAGRVMLESTEQLILMVDSETFNKGILEVIDEKPEHKERIGKVYCLVRHLYGSQGNKLVEKMHLFGQEIDSAEYNKKYDETIIKKVKI